MPRTRIFRLSRLVTRCAMADWLRSTADRSSTTGLPTKNPVERAGGQGSPRRFADKNPGRGSQRRVYFFKPAHDRYDRAKHKRNVGAAAKAHLLTCWLRPCPHDARHACLIEWLTLMWARLVNE